MTLDELRAAFKQLTPTEWGLRAARGVFSGIPFVGGISAEALSIPIDAMAQRAARSDMVIAAFTFEGASGKINTLGRGVSSVIDEGVGRYRFAFSVISPDDYIVNAQATDGFTEILDQSSSGFTMQFSDRQGQPWDRPVKVLVLKVA